jgi:spermidine/putrescine transport system permease protein
MVSRKRNYWLLSPFVIWMLGFLAGPFCILALFSFYTRLPDGSYSSEFTIEAYRRLSDPLYLKIILRSLTLASANTLICLLLAFPTAYFIARLRNPFKVGALCLVLVPLTTSFLIRVFSIMDFLRMKPLGFEWIYTVPGVLSALSYNYLPFAILPLYASFARQDPRIIEAAQDLGASKSRLITRVLIPMHKGALLASALFVFIPSCGEFLIPALVGGSKVALIGNFLHAQFLTARNWPLGSALIVLLLFITFFALWMLKRFGGMNNSIASYKGGRP